MCVHVTAVLIVFMPRNAELRTMWLGSITSAWLARLFGTYLNEEGFKERIMYAQSVCVCVSMSEWNVMYVVECMWLHCLLTHWHLACQNAPWNSPPSSLHWAAVQGHRVWPLQAGVLPHPNPSGRCAAMSLLEEKHTFRTVYVYIHTAITCIHDWKKECILEHVDWALAPNTGTHTHVYTLTHARTNTHKHEHTHKRTHKHEHTNTHAHTHTHTHTHTNTHTRTHARISY